MARFNANVVLRDNYAMTLRIQGQVCYNTSLLPDADQQLLEIYLTADEDEQINQKFKNQ